MKQSMIVQQKSAGSAKVVSASQVGEANIWLVASMLILCLLMVGGLLLFIIGKGLPAFWPKPIDLVVTTSGDFIIGQRIRNTSDSTLFQTGNSQSTNSAYRFVSKSAFSDAGLSRPSRAARLEQDNAAVTYGIPAQVVTDLIPGYREHSALQRIGQLQNEVRGQDNQLPASLQSKAVAVLEDCGAIMLSQTLTSQLKTSYADKYLVQLDNADSWLDFETLPSATASSNRVTAARRVIFRPPNVRLEIKNQLEALKTLKQDILNLRRRQRDLETDNRRIRSLLGSALANAGLDGSATDMACDQLEQQAGDLNDLIFWELLLESLRSLAPTPTDLDSTLPMIDKLAIKKRQQLQTRTRDFEDGLTEKLSQTASAQVRALCKEYRSNIESSTDLNERLSVLDAQLRASEILLAVPDNSEPVEISHTAIDSLQMKKKLPATVRKEIGWSKAELTIEASCPEAGLILFEDTSAQQLRVGCIYQQGYLNSPAQSSTRFAEWRYLPVALANANGVNYLNQLTSLEKLGVYLVRWRTFLFTSPDQNTVGGMFPALWGTIVLTLMMTIAVVPVGVIAALYLREYTTSGTLTALIRISINNLAGVPSIVYGVFGLAFFCYTMGAFIDGGPTNADIVPFRAGTWFVLVGVLAGLGSTAFFCTLSLTRGASWFGWKQRLSHLTLILWILCVGLLLLLVFKSPFFEGFYAQQLPNPTFGKGGILWAALTMALLTLPIVIVCSEEALAAVPAQLREASSACGASKWQTIRRIIIPYALPGILTGAVLAMTRGVGQVAPLMLVGALPAVPELPLDTEFPYLHASRSFMHLGYQVYALGIQSRDTEAARPVVFAAILLLVMSVASLNLLANHLRSRMRRRIQQQVL